MDKLRPDVDKEPKNSVDIIDANPKGWSGVHTALVEACRLFGEGGSAALPQKAIQAVEFAHSRGFESSDDDKRTRFTHIPSVMAWQDAMYAMNELRNWRFPDELVCVAWLIECGGLSMGRGPARKKTKYEDGVKKYIGGTRRLYNRGEHGNGPGWPQSTVWNPSDCQHFR